MLGGPTRASELAHAERSACHRGPRQYRLLPILSTCACIFIRQKQPPVLTFFQPKTTRAYILLTAQMASSVTARKEGRAPHVYTDLGNQDRVTLWKTQLAHADEAINAGTAVGVDFKF